MKSNVLRYIIVTLWLVLGMALVLAPWSDYWDSNYFLFQHPSLALLVRNAFFRGAVSGLGFLDLVLSLESFRHRATAVASRF